MTEIDLEQRYQEWLNSESLDPDMRRELEKMKGDPAAIRSCFGAELQFGTGGMRGIIGPGLNRMNLYVVRRATQGLADYLNKTVKEAAARKVAIAYDTRRFSREFALEAALVLAANGVKAYLFDGERPTPQPSFTIRALGCAAGIVVTASHNPPQYNGYKVYGPDGGQAVSPLVDELSESIRAVHIFRDVKCISREEALAKGLLEMIGQEMDTLYLDRIRGLSLTRPRGELKVVYTPLHGTGAVHIPQLLGEMEAVRLFLVEEQMAGDPNFSTVKLPNPEERESFELALELARRVDADLVLATDPDGDRVGCAVKDDAGEGGYTLLSGNEIGALLLDYLLGRLKERGELPERGVMVKTIVTGELGKKVAEAYGVETMETLTGFKYIGEKIKEFEEKGDRAFLFGYEESYGYLTGTFVRDKDAVIASYLLTEMAAYYRERGQNLLQVLEELSRRHGYYREDLVSMELSDLAEAEGYMQAYEHQAPPVEGLEAVEKRDYYLQKRWDLRTGEEGPVDLPRSRVIYYRYQDGSWFCVRPSGTEPKLKIYLAVNAPSREEARRKLERLKKAVFQVKKR